MGNVFNNSDKSKEEVEEDIAKINKITNNDLFFKKTLRTLNFELSNNILKNLFSNKVVYCALYNERKGLKYLEREFYVNLSQFYNFYNILMNSLPIFYRDNVVRRYSISETTKGNNDDICPICEENKVSIMLECFHFFCENCIHTWLFKKKNNCPMCRHSINLNENKNKDQWNVVDLDKDEYIKESNILFKSVFSDFINLSK